nr:hypothetical protein 10 [bacterium]
MTYESTRQSIETRFKSLWESQYPGIPISWQNVPFEPVGSYISLHLMHGESFLVGLGKVRTFRTTGVISIDIHVPTSQGLGEVNKYADYIVSTFRGTAFDGIICRGRSTKKNLGRTDGYYRTNISIPFYADELE